MIWTRIDTSSARPANEPGVGHEGARERDTLPLTAAEFVQKQRPHLIQKGDTICTSSRMGDRSPEPSDALSNVGVADFRLGQRLAGKRPSPRGGAVSLWALRATDCVRFTKGAIRRVRHLLATV
jgi:hypothetical protein